MPATTFRIKFISDPVCPQCYIAKKRLDRAIELYRKVIPDGKHDIFKISWHAYHLANNESSPAVLTGAVPVSSVQSRTRDTTTASPGNEEPHGAKPIVCDVKTGTCSSNTSSIPIQEAITRRFGGSSSTAQAMQSRLQTKGQLDGINFSFGSRIGSSRDAHRLIYLAGLRDTQDQQQQQQQPDEIPRAVAVEGDTDTMQNRVVTELFKRYFEENGDITSHEMLLDIGEKAGLDKDLVKGWLVSGDGGAAVDQEAEEAVAVHGITGVPVLFINERARIDGAQDVEDFFMEFVRVRDGAATTADES